MKHTILLFVFIGLAGNLCAQEIDLPSNNPEVITYFYTEARSLLNFMEKRRNDDIERSNFIPLFLSYYGKWSISYTLSGKGIWEDRGHIDPGQQYSGIIGSVIRLNKYLSIPLFFSATGGLAKYVNSYMEYIPPDYSLGFYEGRNELIYNESEYYFHSFYTGGGLVVSTKWGSLGALAGYYRLFANDSFFTEIGNRPVRYGVIPALNTSEYPILKYVLRAIENYLSFDFHSSKLDISGISTKIVSQPIEIGNFEISSIYLFNKDEYMNMVLRNRLWGGGITIKYKGLNIGFEMANVDIYEAMPGMLSRYDGANSFLGNKNWNLKFSFGKQVFEPFDDYSWGIDLIVPVRSSDDAIEAFAMPLLRYSVLFSLRSNKSFFGLGMGFIDGFTILGRNRIINEE